MIKIGNKTYFALKILITIFWVLSIYTFLYSSNILKIFFNKKSINVLTWADMIDQETVSNFEKESGIKINLNFYETHEELLAKLEITGGKEYDLVTVTDAGINRLSEKKLFKKIDKSKLNFWKYIDKKFLNQYFDSENKYSIPYNWDIIGLGINKSYFKDKNFEQSWRMIFDEKIMPSKITMLEDPYDNIFIAAQYLYGNTDNINDQKLSEIKELLIKQKPKVEAYGNLRVDYFLKLNICPIVTSQSAYVYRVYKDNPNFSFVIPKEGGFIVIDSIAILSKSKKVDLVYKFINFLYGKKQIENLYSKYGYLPVISDILNELDLTYMGAKGSILSDNIFSKLAFYKRYLSLDKVSDVWIDVKS